MANIPLNNYLKDLTLIADEVKLHGFLSKKGIANFLNVPYAKVPIRFANAKPIPLVDLVGLRGLHVQQYGPRCPQPADTAYLLMSHMSESLSVPGQTEDETRCLNLNIYTPPYLLLSQDGSKLPVFVWIHGGGFNCGDDTSQFDGNHLVKRSLELGQPIVLVVLNYRLNVLGFLSSRELKEEAMNRGEQYVANQGLNDQRLALRWIQSYIGHFGGDATRVTLCGESAGALAVLAQLQAGLPLFQQALLESAPILRLRTEEQAQAAFDKLVSSAGVPSGASGTEKLRALRALTPSKLLDLFDGNLSFPIEDPQWFTTNYEPADFSKFWGHLPSWCRRVVLGNTQHESALMLAPTENLTTSQTIDFTAMLVPDLLIPTSVSEGFMSKRELISWSSREAFIKPLHKLALEAAKNTSEVFMYRISCEDPFPKQALQGYVWHSFGVPLTFYQPPARVYPQLAAVQDEMSAAFISFLYGQAPWEPFGVGHRMMRWDGKKAEMVHANIDKSKQQ